MDGPLNLAIGDGNDQSALEVTETFIDQSYTDNSYTSYQE